MYIPHYKKKNYVTFKKISKSSESDKSSKKKVKIIITGIIVAVISVISSLFGIFSNNREELAPLVQKFLVRFQGIVNEIKPKQNNELEILMRDYSLQPIKTKDNQDVFDLLPIAAKKLLRNKTTHPMTILTSQMTGNPFYNKLKNIKVGDTIKCNSRIERVPKKKREFGLKSVSIINLKIN